MIQKIVIVPITLYRFGNREHPRLPREGRDITVENGLVNPTEPPTGVSMFADIKNAPLREGHYYRLDAGNRLPLGLGLIADGQDVGGRHSSGHYTLYPTRPMSWLEFQEKFLNCGWVYCGKKFKND